jgi:hypothetical protein
MALLAVTSTVEGQFGYGLSLQKNGIELQHTHVRLVQNAYRRVNTCTNDFLRPRFHVSIVIKQQALLRRAPARENSFSGGGLTELTTLAWRECR